MLPRRSRARGSRVILLAGLVLDATFGWWWADPLAALGIAWLALRRVSRHGPATMVTFRRRFVTAAATAFSWTLPARLLPSKRFERQNSPQSLLSCSDAWRYLSLFTHLSAFCGLLFDLPSVSSGDFDVPPRTRAWVTPRGCTIVYGTETLWGGIVAPDSPVIWRCDGEDPIIGNGFATRWGARAYAPESVVEASGRANQPIRGTRWARSIPWGSTTLRRLARKRSELCAVCPNAIDSDSRLPRSLAKHSFRYAIDTEL